MRIDTHHHHKKAGENLAFVFFINLAFNIVVIVAALATNSMAILADFIHDASDTISIALAWFLEHVAQRDSTDKYSYGYQRFSILGVGIVFKFVSVYRLHKGETYNEKAIFFHQLGDIFEWVAILILSLVLMFWEGAQYLDPFVSIGIALWLIFNLGRNLYKSIEVLLQKTPDYFDVDEFRQSIENIEGVNAIDDFHIWSLDGIDSVMTLKVDVDFGKDVGEIKKEIYAISKKYHVVDITIELE